MSKKLNKTKGIGSSEDNLVPPQHTYDTNYLLVIGINKYKHFPELNNAVRDSMTIKDILLERYEFKASNLFELYDEQATRKNILNTLEKLEDLITKDDNLLIFFSGHGTMNTRKNKGFWVPVEAQRNQADYIANSRIRDQLENIQAHHIYLLVDSCFSGSIVMRSDEFVKRVNTMPSRRVLTSGRNEVVSDGNPGMHSPFANCLIKYLEINRSHSLSASRLEQHVKEHTPRSSEQTPSSAYIYGIGDQGGEFIFRLKEKTNRKPQNFKTGRFTDSRDNRTYRTIEINGLTWLAENLSYDIGEGCSSYKNKPSHEKEYGRLYTWHAAKDACPKGWRLPTLKEWDQLCEFFGKTQEAFQALIKGGYSGFNALLGGKGSENGRYIELGDKGYYWTSDEKGDKKAVEIAFVLRSQTLPDGTDFKTYLFSCRCVQILENT